MKRFLTLFAAMVCTIAAFAQNNISIIVKDAQSGELLPGAIVNFPDLRRSSSTDDRGEARFNDLPAGKYKVQYRYIGYPAQEDSLQLPLNQTPLIVELERGEGEELDEVLVSTTRSSRTIANIPTRIEVIAGEELDEKANMKPGDIRMVLNESTGIQMQQTSATSGNASIRIQGLDGRYTQVLKDGFPVYSGASSGLGLLQTPPLDLRQVEVIKGSASTLYGGGAIAGLVNLVSKTPGEGRELNFHLNGTSAGGLDLNSFYSEKYGKTGITLFAARNSNKPYIPGSAEFTAIPEFVRYTLNPKMFLNFNDKTRLNFGLNTSFETRTGGSNNYFSDGPSSSQGFFEKNNSDRLSSQLAISHELGVNSELNIRNSFSYFNRRINTPGYSFDGSQLGSFSELNISTTGKQAEWVAGVNLWTDHFKENLQTLVPLRDYNQTTAGVFIQNNVHTANWLEIESGIRGDYVIDYGFVFLPRISALIKLNSQLNSRIGGGLGYKAPTIFTEESERIQYQNVLPVLSVNNKLEKSYGLNWDINYRTSLFSDQVAFSINQLFFYTFLDNPLSMEPDGIGQYRFVNLPGHMDSRGLETNVKLSYADLKLFLGYSLTDAQIHIGDVLRQNPLTAKHRLNNVLMYEVEEKWKLGAEAYYFSRQKLNDGSMGRSYWIFGFMAEKLWEKFSLYINFENFSNTRQTRFDSIYRGNISNPVFGDIYAPLDGFVVNGGLKLRL